MSARSFRTNDADEAMSIWGEHFNQHKITPLHNGPLGFELTTTSLGPLSVGIVRYGSEVVSESVGPRSFVAIPLKGAIGFQFGTVAVTSNPYTAAVRSASRPTRLRGWSVGDESVFVLGMAADALQNHLGRILGRDDVGPITFSPLMDLRSRDGAQWWNFTRSIAIALDSTGGLATHPMLSTAMSDAVMTGLLIASNHSHRDAIGAWTRPAAPPVVRRAIALIDERAHEPLTVVEVAAKVGCGVRALQIAFKKHLGETPSEYLRRVRMDRAHTMLRLATPETASVAEIARTWGFNQLGRFAVQYRQTYGVSPKVTLRQ